MNVPNEVRKRIDVAAPIDPVWTALTTPEGLLAWFPTERAEIDLRPGGTCRFVWRDSSDEGIVDEVEPPRRLVFRWRPAGLDRPFTTVSFTLAPIEVGTRVTLVETGFASLPDQVREQSWEGNDAGWAEELDQLKAYLEAA